MSTVDLAPLTAEIKAGFAAVVAAIEAGNAAVDIAPLTEQVTALVAAAEAANTQAASVIGTFSDGARVKVFDETPAP